MTIGDLRPWGLLAFLCLLAGCGSVEKTSSATLTVRGLTFENRSRSSITAIQLLVPATGAFVSCGHIAPGNRCATK